ncbi:MAG: putative toxin-antitoxin system toxin component, PIN family [Acidobacteriota bacterium]|nr:putative toxin-antitoxin system toxin component, PIN family [Acidobacteriota bacterium]
MPPKKIKSVFDCNVYLQTFISGKGTAAKCKKLVDEGLIELYVSREILSEVRDVLTRPELQAKFPNATPETVKAFLEDLQGRAVFVRSVGKHFELMRDKKDEPYLNLAFDIKADYIISWDKDLLDLMTDFTPEAKEFRQKFRPLKIIKPTEFLKVIREKDVPLNP